ncbi:SDR family oxidoreductase [Novosphingobium sp. PS1R-30]|uniref:SDR family oxidoreductase n=1 Tax=Novosphingobium anseongense TaxID=3133436 RepID=A0ABU8S0R8_9SPHN
MNGRFENNAPLALVVGCGDMGMGIARALGRVHPLLLVDIDRERLAGCVAALKHDGYDVTGHVCDISKQVDVEGLAWALLRSPGVKVLAHVAAIGNSGADWRRVIEVDLVAAGLVARAVEPALVAGAVAIFISSTGAQRCPRDPMLHELIDNPLRTNLCARLRELAGRDLNFLEAYFIAKMGVNRLVERLAIAWGPRRMRAVSVSPGLIDSTMGRTGGSEIPIYAGGAEPRLGTREEKARIEVPLGRQGRVLEVVGVVDFLASDAASFISGIDVPVDGGSSAFWRAIGDTSGSLGAEQLAPGFPASP